MFALKKLVSAFLYPLPLALCLLAVALGLLWFTERQRVGRILVTAAFGILLLFSLPAIATGLLAPLEREQESLFPAARLVAATLAAQRHPRWVVVLGGGHITDERLPPLARLTSSALLRLAEGIRLHRALPNTKLVLSGGGDDALSHADTLAQAALSLGVSEEDMVLERSTVDTADEASKLVNIVGSDDFILVTSALHMPRALALFKARGVDPIAAPTDYVVRHSVSGLRLDDVFPRPIGLACTELAEHELLGRIWAKLSGRT
jgi:uncharacterized SAM-binding protein YcdF (DUF218 family)